MKTKNKKNRACALPFCRAIHQTPDGVSILTLLLHKQIYNRVIHIICLGLKVVKVKSFFPCEEIVHKYLPAMRALVAKKLGAKGFTQQEIAAELGVTQAAVSKYLSNKYNAEIREVERKPALEKACSEIIGKITLEKKGGKGKAKTAICFACAQYKAGSRPCGIIERIG